MRQLILFLIFACIFVSAQTIKVDSFYIKNSPLIGTYKGVTIKEGSMGSGICYLPGSGNVFYCITDRGPNADATDANGGKETILFPFPSYTPKIFTLKAEADSLAVVGVLPIKRPDGSNTTGVTELPGFGNTGEVSWSAINTVVPNDEWGIDPEGLVLGLNNDFWACEEYGTSILHIDKSTGKIINRYWPFTASGYNKSIDSVFAKRKPNRGFEGITITPGGKIYALLQSPLYNPSESVGDNSRIHRLLELDPATNKTRMFAYVHPASTGDIRNKDWKIGDLAAINDKEFLVIEHAEQGSDDIKSLYKIDITNATPITAATYGGKTPEALKDSATIVGKGIIPVKKTYLFNILSYKWNKSFDKCEGLTILNDTTIAIMNDNDFGIDSPNKDGVIVGTGKMNVMYRYTLPQSMKLNFKSAYVTGVEKSHASEMTFSLRQNYPNPFNPATTIEYTVPNSGNVTINIYNAVGQQVAELINAEQNAGVHSVVWNAQSFSSGIYFCELKSDKFRAVKKLMLLK